MRYENGQKPTRANANLIRAAKNPSFMRDCLERDGNRISPMQRDRAEQIIYAEVTFNEKGDVMDINELYSLTLQQEILNEKAAEMLGDLSRMRREAKIAETPRAPWCTRMSSANLLSPNGRFSIPIARPRSPRYAGKSTG